MAMNETDDLKSGGSRISQGPSSNPTEFTTQSVFCASWLVYCGHAPQQFRMIAPRKGEFVFRLSPPLQENVAEYFDGKAQVELKAFIRTYNRIRDIIMDNRRGPPAMS